MHESYRVKITRQAKKQIADIVTYISEELCAPDAARSTLDYLEKSMSNLKEFPERNQLVEEEPWRMEGIRRIVVKNYLVYYWIDKANMMVHIIAVIYARRDQVKQLKDMKMND